jgi:hypothetical protein
VGAGPPKGTGNKIHKSINSDLLEGLHRYAFLLFKQPQKIHADKMDE